MLQTRSRGIQLHVPAPFDVVHASAELHLGNVFIQDEVTLASTLKLTAGINLERYTFTGWEYLPNARLAWQPTSDLLWWAAVSRVVRTPSRLDRDLVALPILIAAPNFASETLIAYEAGYRGQLADNITLSVSGFYNVYDRLRTTSLLPPGSGVLAQLQNGMEGNTYGVEAWTQFSLANWWRLSSVFTALEKNLKLKPGIGDASNFQAAGNDPARQFQIRSLMTPLPEVEIDVGLRVVSDLKSPVIPGYTQLDKRLGLHVAEGLELTLSAFNTLSGRHAEGGPANTRREIRRSINAGFAYRF